MLEDKENEINKKMETLNELREKTNKLIYAINKTKICSTAALASALTIANQTTDNVELFWYLLGLNFAGLYDVYNEIKRNNQDRNELIKKLSL